MQRFTNTERLELEEYVTNQLLNTMHIQFDGIDFNSKIVLISFRTTPVIFNIPHYEYKIFVWKKQGLYYIKYKEDTLIFSIENNIPIQRRGIDYNKDMVYEIEDIDDVFNILEDIFDTLRARDEY